MKPFARPLLDKERVVARKQHKLPRLIARRQFARAATMNQHQTAAKQYSKENRMNQAPSPKEPITRPLLDEADIGSGEKSPGQKETDELIRQIPPLPPGGSPDGGDQPTKPERAR
jgi:hypothetical protein